jgi:hypothetical protein
VLALLVVACGPGQPGASTARPTAAGTSTGPAVASAATPTPAPSPTLPAVPDFAVVAYQGDQVFGGHDGHFSAVFTAGRPVVLLYFAGL